MRSAKIGLVAFLIPYMFVYGPELLAQGSVSNILWALLMAIVGVFVLATSLTGWLKGQLNIIERILFFATSILLISANLLTDLIGLILLVVLLSITLIKNRTAVQKGLFESGTVVSSKKGNPKIRSYKNVKEPQIVSTICGSFTN